MRFVHLFPSAHARPGLWRAFATLALCLLLASCASVQRANKNESLRKLQYDYSAAIRWGDFEGAWTLVDPKLREEKPLTDIDFSRYKQVQISTYSDMGGTVEPSGVMVRDVEIGVINRNTLTERTVRYRERWRYDETAKTWWLLSGLPDLWQGD